MTIHTYHQRRPYYEKTRISWPILPKEFEMNPVNCINLSNSNDNSF